MPYRDIEKRREWQRRNSRKRNSSPKRMAWIARYKKSGAKRRTMEKFRSSEKYRNWVSTNRSKLNTRQAKSLQNPKGKYRAYRKGALKRSIPFELTMDQFMLFWGKNCAYCGGAILTVGIDRVDNGKGYIVSNLASCCRGCNKMKSDLSVEDFVARCRKVVIIAEQSGGHS